LLPYHILYYEDGGSISEEITASVFNLEGNLVASVRFFLIISSTLKMEAVFRRKLLHQSSTLKEP
jgi:hypothetical protein